MYAHRLHGNGRHALLWGAAIALACVGLLAGPAPADMLTNAVASYTWYDGVVDDAVVSDSMAVAQLYDSWYDGHVWKIKKATVDKKGVVKGKDYPDIHSKSPLKGPLGLRTEAKILDGLNMQTHDIKVKMEWGYRGADQQWLSSDILHLTGNEGNKYVLQMTYDEKTLNGMEQIWAAAGEQTIYTVDPRTGRWIGVWDYLSSLGQTTVTSGSKLYNFQGSWDKAGKPFELGAWGVDTKENKVWAVIDFDGIFVPEPGTMALLALGGLGVLLRRRKKA